MAPQPQCRLEIHYQIPQVDDRQRFQLAAQWIAEQYNIAVFQVSIAIVNDATIHELNQEHLGHDWPTDVISFIFEADEESHTVDGEIVASAQTATRLSAAAQWRPEDELLLYVVHGLLHLAGLDDIEPQDESEMRKAERDCLLALGVVGADKHLARWDDVSA